MSYGERLQTLGLPSLEHRRERADVILYRDRQDGQTEAIYDDTGGYSLINLKYRSSTNDRANSFSNTLKEVFSQTD